MHLLRRHGLEITNGIVVLAFVSPNDFFHPLAIIIYPSHPGHEPEKFTGSSIVVCSAHLLRKAPDAVFQTTEKLIGAFVQKMAILLVPQRLKIAMKSFMIKRIKLRYFSNNS